MPTPSAFDFVPDAWEALRNEAQRAKQTVAVHPDVARWRAYRALDMVLATIEAYEGVPPQHRPLADRLTHTTFNEWIQQHPAPVKMWMHRIRQAGLVGAHVDSEWARSVEDAQRVVETLHKLLWWLVDTYGTVPADERPPLTWSALDTPRTRVSSVSKPPDETAAPASSARAPEANAPNTDAPSADVRDADVRNADVREWIATVRASAPGTPSAQQAALHVLKHIHAANTALLTPFTADA